MNAGKSFIAMLEPNSAVYSLMLRHDTPEYLRAGLAAFQVSHEEIVVVVPEPAKLDYPSWWAPVDKLGIPSWLWFRGGTEDFERLQRDRCSLRHLTRGTRDRRVRCGRCLPGGTSVPTMRPTPSRTARWRTAAPAPAWTAVSPSSSRSAAGHPR